MVDALNKFTYDNNYIFYKHENTLIIRYLINDMEIKYEIWKNNAMYTIDSMPYGLFLKRRSDRIREYGK